MDLPFATPANPPPPRPKPQDAFQAGFAFDFHACNFYFHPEETYPAKERTCLSPFSEVSRADFSLFVRETM